MGVDIGGEPEGRSHDLMLIREKHKKMGKKAMCLIFAFLFSINSFAAVVSDNDGSAFVTKAEFEALKSNFASQVDQYNISIDSKIDGAIANYLAGIHLSKKTEIEPLVSNYSRIMWQPNFKVYGQWKKWTNNTTKTASSGNVWFEPALCEKRWQLRYTELRVYDYLEHAYGVVGFYMRFAINRLENGATLGSGSWGSSGYWQAPPTMCVQMHKDSNQNWYVSKNDPLMNMYVMTGEINVKPHTRVSGSGQSIYEMGNRQLSLNSWTPLAISGDEYLRYQAEIKDAYGTDTTTYTSSINKNNSQYPWVWRRGAPSLPCEFGSATTAGNTTDTTNYIRSDYFNTGCTWHYLDPTTYANQKLMIGYMMLGSNYDLDVNVAKDLTNKSEGYGYDMSESTQFANASMNGNWQVAFSPINMYKDGAGYWNKNPSATVTLKIPHWPTKKLRELTTNEFYNGKDALKIGEGMPIVLNLDQKGTLQIEFDYDIKYVNNDTSYKTSQDLYIDLKKGNFLDKSTSASDFYDAYSEIVDVDTTTKNAYRYQNYKYPKKTGKCAITVPLEKNQSLWFRMRPSNETGGYYANMSNLKLAWIND